jgi:hypothetical protein
MRAVELFVNDHGLRAGWRLFAWLAVVLGFEVLLGFALSVATLQLHATNHAFLDPRWMMASDAAVLMAAMVATLIAGRAEHLGLPDYYIPSRSFFGRYSGKGCSGASWPFRS